MTQYLLTTEDLSYAKFLITRRNTMLKEYNQELHKAETYLKTIGTIPLFSFLKLKSKTQYQSKRDLIKRTQRKIKKLKTQIKTLKTIDLLSAKGLKLIS